MISLRDIKYAIRLLRRSPGFTAVAVLTLAIGIGANAAIFTFADAILLRPLPYQKPDQLVWMNEETATNDSTGVSWPNFRDWQRLNTVFIGMAVYRDINLQLAGDSYPELLPSRYVSNGYFDLMGGKPILGRTFEAGENAIGGPDVAVLSYEFWQQRFGGSPRALGQTLRLNEKAFTIVGVMPRGFGAVSRTALWAPLEQNLPKPFLTGRDIAWLTYAVGRMKPGVSSRQAQQDIARVGDVLAREYPAIDTSSRPVLKTLNRQMQGDSRAVLLLVSAAVALLLLITCANLACLLLVKTGARHREFSVRLALGATQENVLQQVLTEGLLLAIAGGALGALGAWAALRYAAVLLPGNVPLAGPLALDGRALAFTFGVTLLSCILFGMAPARFAMRTDLQSALRSSAHHLRGGHRRAQAALIVCEMGLAMAVLVGAGLLVRTMAALMHTDVGFDANHLFTGTVTLLRADYPKDPDTIAFIQQGVDSIARIPGVESAAAVFPVPFTPQIYQVWLAIEGRIPKVGEEPTAYVSTVSWNYLDTMKIPVLEGHGFTVADTADNVRNVVIDRQLAATYWPGQSPVGRSIKMHVQDFGDSRQKPWTIVGVAGSVRAESLDTQPEGRVYVLMNRLPFLTTSFVARTKTDPRALAPAFENALHRVNSRVPVFNVQTMESAIHGSQQPRRLAMLLLLSFAIAALVLTAMGIYGVIAYVVKQRTSEIGIRMALGALPRDVLGLVVGYGAALAAGGIAAGLVATLALTRLMRSLLYGVGTEDPPTFLLVAGLMMIVALGACYFPARRAMRVDPMVALRYE
jgi:putative ABC transport system permease protein